jgi:hypothetical protein
MKNDWKHIPRSNDSVSRIVSLSFFGCAVLILCSGLHAQEHCNVEVKLLLSASEVQPAVAAFNGTKETPGRVYFFDTDTLDLLSQGVILRLRQGARTDLTVKLRPPKEKKITVSSEGHDDLKCEVDLIGGSAVSSYSISKRYDLEQLPESGNDVFHSLSPGQKKLLNDANISVDWTRVKRIAEIRTAAWKTEAQPHLGKLTLELWEWPGGKVLELSTKVSPDAGPPTYTELQQLVRTERLSMSPTQLAKTSIALEAIVHAAAD